VISFKAISFGYEFTSFFSFWLLVFWLQVFWLSILHCKDMLLF